MDECKALVRGLRHVQTHPRGTAVQFKSMKPVLKATGTKRMKPKYDKPLSNVAFKINLRHYSVEAHSLIQCLMSAEVGRCRVHSIKLVLKALMLCFQRLKI